METIKKHRAIIIIGLVFTILYALISLVNHYNFRTYALDLGLYTSALYDYIHFQWNDCGVFKVVEENILADHFDLYLILFSPLSLVLGTYTLLIVQIIAIIFGGVGVYMLFKSQVNKSRLAIPAAAYFYLFFGVYSALAFDYHSNVIAATLIPWLFYAVSKKQLRFASSLIVLVIIGKENMSLWLAFILLGLAIEHRSNKFLRTYLILASLVSLASFLAITTLIMPAISIHGSYNHFHYSILGENMQEALIHLLTHPLESIKVLFTNHSPEIHGDYVKLETHLLLLVSGVVILFRKPQFLLMLIPIYFQKFYHDTYIIWGIGSQYNIEFTPILAIGVFYVISEIKSTKLQTLVSCLILVLVVVSTNWILREDTILYTNKPRIRFDQKRHYQRHFNVKGVHESLSKIPKDANVSAQSSFVPHLSLRNHIYQFPIIKNAEYIVYLRGEETYPISKDEFEAIVNDLEKSKDWEVFLNDDVTILKRVSL